MSDGKILRTIDECCDILDNYRKPINDEIRQTMQGNIPYYGANGIQGYINSFIFDEELILMAEDGGNFEQFDTRPIAYKISGKSWINNHAHILKAKSGYCQDYLFYSLVNKDIIKYIKGGTRSKLNKSDLVKIEVEIPNSFSKQQEIAHILTTCDTVIEQTQSAIAKYKAIKQGLLHDLFTRGLDASDHLRPSHQDAPELYKESELGMIPKEWEVKRLEELTEKIGSGVTPTGGSDVYQTSGILFIRSQNVLIGGLSIEDAAFITTEIDEKMQGSRVKPYDVLLNITGASIGRCAYFPNELKSANVNQHVCIIRFKSISKSLAIYASEFLNGYFGQNQINKSIAGGNREGLNFQQIKSFYFPLISPSELDKIAKIIELQSNKIKTEETLLQKYQSIKRGLMGDLLGGRREVKIK
jgi:type I restriction enzyme S subunit